MMLVTYLAIIAFNQILSSYCELNSDSDIQDGFKGESVDQVPLLQPKMKMSQKFEQILDHFNPSDIRTWKQLYHSEESYYKKGGPVYLYIWDSSPVDLSWAQGSYWFSHALEHNAMIFSLEHRFFNKNQPFWDTSTRSLQYLNSAQALADVASFIAEMNEKYEFPADTKWIVFGGSYGGNMAAWLRYKYPHLVYGAVASSATVHAQLELPQYLETVGRVLGDFKTECKDDIAEANKKLDELSQTILGRLEIGRTFKLCSPLLPFSLDISLLMSGMTDYVSKAVENDYWGERVKEICNTMLDNSDKLSAIKRYAKVIHMLMNNKGEKCLPTKFAAYVTSLKRFDLLSPHKTTRAVLYQSCTEFALYGTSKSAKSIFSTKVDLNYFVSLCTNVFTKSFNKIFINAATDRTNRAYGGSGIDTPRVVFVQGTNDPYLSAQITSTKEKKAFEVVSIKGGAHCSDLQPPTKQDSKEVKEARAQIAEILDQWIN